MPKKQTTKTTRKTSASSTPRKKTTTRKKATTKKARKVTLKTRENVTYEVQKRAYELYLQRGCDHGDDMGDWLKAEQEVTRKRELVTA